ncbi:hypothetical protein ACFQGE_11040 [Halomicroarcula sp. GCM10025817]|uniref:hypothetical protein n=1 Tax=Haloarcula TaxID=2237 RepID=UPI0023E7E0D8|nr:hypothetical protein [Halomicroarcula sp. SYNS111]
MQRRAAAAYFVFFLVVSVAAYAYIGVAESQRPEVNLDETAELTNESTFSVDGTTYTASNIHLASGGGGHGGGGSMVAELAWTNESARFTQTVEHNTTTTYQNETYLALTDNETSTLTLRQQFNVSQLLREDPAVRNSLATQNGTQYVVYRENETLRPLEQWLPEPETLAFSPGDTYELTTDSGTQQATVAAVSGSGATLEWTGAEEQTRELSEGGNVTLSGQQYFAHFPDHSTVQVVSIDEYPEYQTALERQDYFHERKNGLWGVSILSGIAAVLLLGMAYMPTRG